MEWTDSLAYPKPDGTTGLVQARVTVTDLWAQTFLGSGNSLRPRASAEEIHETRGIAQANAADLAQVKADLALIKQHLGI